MADLYWDDRLGMFAGTVDDEGLVFDDRKRRSLVGRIDADGNVYSDFKRRDLIGTIDDEGRVYSGRRQRDPIGLVDADGRVYRDMRRRDLVGRVDGNAVDAGAALLLLLESGVNSDTDAQSGLLGALAGAAIDTVVEHRRDRRRPVRSDSSEVRLGVSQTTGARLMLSIDPKQYFSVLVQEGTLTGREPEDIDAVFDQRARMKTKLPFVAVCSGDIGYLRRCDASITKAHARFFVSEVAVLDGLGVEVLDRNWQSGMGKLDANVELGARLGS